MSRKRNSVSIKLLKYIIAIMIIMFNISIIESNPMIGIYSLGADLNTLEPTSIEKTEMSEENKIIQENLTPAIIDEITGDAFIITNIASVAENSYILEKSEIEYTINVTNIANRTIENVVISNIIPDGITYKEAYILKYNHITNSYDQEKTGVIYNNSIKNVIWNVGSIAEQEQVTVKLIVIANKINEEIDAKQVISNAKVFGDKTKETISEAMTVNILKDRVTIKLESDVLGNSVRKGDKIKYKITVNSNYNSINFENIKIKDALPEGLEYIKSQCSNGRAVEFDQESRTVNVITNMNAEEEIILEIIAQLIDTNLTNLSIKNKAIVESGIMPEKESKAIIHNIVNVKQKQTSGVFDLQLDKKVNEITLMNAKGITKYKYNTNFAKIEIPGKNIVNSTILIKYKLTIANIGEEAGYAKTIVNSKPGGLKFNSELNPGWYEKDGNLYTNMLDGKIINPGEMKEIYLVLSKILTNDSKVYIKDIATISQSMSNKDTININENETTGTEIIVGLKTGDMTYIITSLLGMITLAGGVYTIKKIVLT